MFHAVVEALTAATGKVGLGALLGKRMHFSDEVVELVFIKVTRTAVWIALDEVFMT